jgi:hypothetical protein
MISPQPTPLVSQRNTRWDRSRAWRTDPQFEQILDDGNHRGALASALPYQVDL